MDGDPEAACPTGLSGARAAWLAEANAPGLAALREYVDAGSAVAFLGAGVSEPLYPAGAVFVGTLITAALERGLPAEQADTLRELGSTRSDSAVEILRSRLGVPVFREVLRQALAVRRDEVTGRTWTPAQEMICRCAFRGIVTTAYDPGIVDVRTRVRTRASSTGFSSWSDELGLDRWRTGAVFGDDELPVLFAHGYHSRPDEIVLATTEYRRAYAGALPRVLADLFTSSHLVWLGFDFSDQRIAGVLREVAERTGTRPDPGAAPRHVAVMPWDPVSGADPATLRRLAEIEYGAELVLYPVLDGDHSALVGVLAELADPGFAAAVATPAAPSVAEASAPEVVPDPSPVRAPGRPEARVRWVPGEERAGVFAGRVEELARLQRWAADPQVRLVGVTAWGGAGKTALVTEWVARAAADRWGGGRAGVFGWSFYANASPERWVEGLLAWAGEQFGVQLVGPAGTQVGAAQAVLTLLRGYPVVLVLDGLEVLQEGPAGGGFGRLLDGVLREVLTQACRVPHAGLVVLTSRFPFADLESFDGGAARMLEVPAFTPAEGAQLLAGAGGAWLPVTDREDLVRQVDGHALAVSVLAGLLADQPLVSDLNELRSQLAVQGRTNQRVSKVLTFYADRLSPEDRTVLAVVSLFAHPVSPGAVLTVAAHDMFTDILTDRSAGGILAAARGRLGGLITVHPDGTLSAHPLVRDTFRPRALEAAATAAEVALTDVPREISTPQEGLRVVETIELLLDADQWTAAAGLYSARTNDGDLWRWLPAARLGQRAATAFVTTPQRRQACSRHLPPRALGFFLNEAGLNAQIAGDLLVGLDYLNASVEQDQAADDRKYLSIDLQNLAETQALLGHLDTATTTALEALGLAHQLSDKIEERDTLATLGWIADLSGDTVSAENHFLAADHIEHAQDPYGEHLYSLRGVQWAEYLIRTRRPGPADHLTHRNHQISIQFRRNDDRAGCERVLARLALPTDPTAAHAHATTATTVFRTGEFLTELADTLSVLAETCRVLGDYVTAHAHATEALDLAAPRGLLIAHAAALAVRARIHADQAASTLDSRERTQHLANGRDAADAALRLATRHTLAWHEYDALTAHAHFDHAESADHGWQAQADALLKRIIPPGLDPDPLTTVEREVAAQQAADPDGLEDFL